MKKIDAKSLIKSTLPVIIAGGGGSIFVSIDKINYDLLNKPFLNPPKILFPIMWTIIYVLCIFATYPISKNEENTELKQKCLISYYVNMFLNLLWSVTFFGLGQKVAALIVLCLLYFSLAVMFIFYKKSNKKSSYLLVPYLLWLLLALYLNICIVFLN